MVKKSDYSDYHEHKKLSHKLKEKNAINIWIVSQNKE